MKAVPLGATEGTCSSCAKRILWVDLADGTRVPLDAVAPTYQLEILRDSGDQDSQRWHRWVRANQEGTSEPAFVSHFATCPQATAHSRRSR